jgi:outer membrane biosynthesis protein TonB
VQAPLINDMRNSSSGRNVGIMGTTLIHLLLFGILVLAGFSASMPDKNGEGILVNFGTDETGFGSVEPSPPAVQVEFSNPPRTKVAVKVSDEHLLTQNIEEAPAIKKVNPEAEKKKLEKVEADKKIKEQLEAEKIRIREEEAEKKRIAAEQQRESDIMNRTKNALANSKNTGTSSTGEGIAGGPGNQGDPNGSVNSNVRGNGSGQGDKGSGTGNNGISYKLEGRREKSLPKPKYEVQVDGIVVVDVSVDGSGKVVQATPGTKGSTTLDEYLLKVAKEAALEARFEEKQDAPVIQKGTITYNFILK